MAKSTNKRDQLPNNVHFIIRYSTEDQIIANSIKKTGNWEFKIPKKRRVLLFGYSRPDLIPKSSPKHSCEGSSTLTVYSRQYMKSNCLPLNLLGSILLPRINGSPHFDAILCEFVELISVRYTWTKR